LSFCLRKLKTDKKPLLVFGTSLSSNDKHIVNAICKSKRELIIAIYVGNKTETILNREVAEFKEMFDEKCLSIDFINSDSLFNF
jgi:CO dehydrogenase/acetyl-CoA synthase epsilon subunit